MVVKISNYLSKYYTKLLLVIIVDNASSKKNKNG